MGESLVDFSAQGDSSRSCFCHGTSGTPGCEHSCAYYKDEGLEAGITCGQDSCDVEELGTALTKVMHVFDDDCADLDEDSEDDDALRSLESDSTDDLVDAEADTDVVISSAFPIDGLSRSSIDNSDDGNSSTNGTPPLVSAMKGTRAKQGIVTKLSVSWAPDVYDPPVTSKSHTVRGQQRSSRKSHYKYKPTKSSSSSSNHGASNSKRDKKYSHHGSSSSSSSRKDKKHSYRSSSSSIIRTVSSGPCYRKAYNTISDGSSGTDSHFIASVKAYPLVHPETIAVREAVPVLKTIEQVKCTTSCKEKPFNLLSRQFSPVKYKGMFSFWSQNQLAS